MFTKSLETQSALGPALQAAFKLMSPTGGRISVFQTQLPSVGTGALKSREEPNQRATAKVRKAKRLRELTTLFCMHRWFWNCMFWVNFVVLLLS